MTSFGAVWIRAVGGDPRRGCVRPANADGPGAPGWSEWQPKRCSHSRGAADWSPKNTREPAAVTPSARPAL